MTFEIQCKHCAMTGRVADLHQSGWVLAKNHIGDYCCCCCYVCQPIDTAKSS